jgi:hypothetical protein
MENNEKIAIGANKEKNVMEVLRDCGALNKKNKFIPNVEFERNPILDRVSITRTTKNGVEKEGATSICVDTLIATSMIELLGSRMAYIHWVRKAVDYILDEANKPEIQEEKENSEIKSHDNNNQFIKMKKQSNASISRLVQREAVGYIQKNTIYKKDKKINE